MSKVAKMHTLPHVVTRMIARVGARLLRSRSLMRAPIWIFRAGLGRVFGSRLLLLEHTGRRSGKKREVVLEVFGHPAPDTYLVASGFGPRSQWFRNVCANSAVRVMVTGRAPAQATARVLDQAEADRALRAYVSQHARAWEAFKSVLEDTLGGAVDAPDTQLPIVELRLLEVGA